LRAPRLSAPLFALAAIAPLIASLALATPARAANPASSYAAMANDPLTPDQGGVLESQLVDAIEASPPGSEIRIANPRMDKKVGTALAAAAKRGVLVHVVTDPKVVTKSTAKAAAALKAALGTDTSADSFVYFTPTAAYQPSVTSSKMHAKTALFSDVGGSAVSVIGSQDLYPSVPEFEWDTALVTGNETIYRNLSTWFDGMTKHQTKSFSGKISAGALELYLFPRQGDTSTHNFFTDMLTPVSCAGGTKVDLMTYDWRKTMVSVAQRLAALSRAGCAVRVITYSTRTDPAVLQTLQRGGVPTHYSDHTTGGTAYLSHTKLIAIAGRYGGKSVYTTIQGSANVALGSVKVYDDNMVRVKNDRAVYDTYAGQFNRVWKAGRTVPTVPTTLTGSYSPTAVAGRLRAAGGAVPGRTVRLQRYHSGGWHNVRTATTDANGRVKWSIALRDPIRLVFAGATNLRAKNSATMRLTPTKLTVASHRAAVKGRLRSGGKGLAGRRIDLERRVKGAWKTVGHRRTDRKGRITWHVTGKGRVRLAYAGATGIAPATSASATVVPPTKK